MIRADDVISQEYVYKLIPKISDYLKELRDTIRPEKHDPLKLEIKPSSSSDDDSELSYILNNKELLYAYTEALEQEVDPSLRVEKADDEEEPEPKHVDNTLYVGITLFVGAIILIIILIGLIKGR
jgi:hypothetical protein